jgi:hypothetical protein
VKEKRTSLHCTSKYFQTSIHTTRHAGQEEQRSRKDGNDDEADAGGQENLETEEDMRMKRVRHGHDEGGGGK